MKADQNGEEGKMELIHIACNIVCGYQSPDDCHEPRS